MKPLNNTLKISVFEEINVSEGQIKKAIFKHAPKILWWPESTLAFVPQINFGSTLNFPMAPPFVYHDNFLTLSALPSF